MRRNLWSNLEPDSKRDLPCHQIRLRGVARLAATGRRQGRFLRFLMKDESLQKPRSRAAVNAHGGRGLMARFMNGTTGMGLSKNIIPEAPILGSSIHTRANF
jgi:hypothetical protein